MSRTVLFDIQAGAAGDILLASLMDAGLDMDALIQELQGLSIESWSLSPQRITRYGLSGMTAGISAPEEKRHRNLRDIIDLLAASILAPSVKESAEAVFTALARAEAAVHGIPVDEIHFHEIGAMDSIIDICAFCIALKLLKIDKVCFNEIPLGTGELRIAHGRLTNPAPALLQLSRGYRVHYTGREGELITPTAAALLTTLGVQTADIPIPLKLEGCGTGFGTRDYGYPSYTRALIGEEDCLLTDSPLLIECNIDDMNPQIYPPLMDRLLEEGALDVYLTPVIMKKGRPGTLLTVLAPENRISPLTEIIMQETTTLGIRINKTGRMKLDREFRSVTLFDKTIRMKLGLKGDKIMKVQPEFEDCLKAAKASGHSVREIMDMARETLLRGVNKTE